jgi:hypothetical protein
MGISVNDGSLASVWLREWGGEGVVEWHSVLRQMDSHKPSDKGVRSRVWVR